MITPLTPALASELAANLSAGHRADVLTCYPTVQAWALSRQCGHARCFVKDGPVFAAGVQGESVGVLWLAGREGWGRYVKHALRMWEYAVKNRLYERFALETWSADAPARKFAERMGFKVVGDQQGVTIYEARA